MKPKPPTPLSESLARIIARGQNPNDISINDNCTALVIRTQEGTLSYGLHRLTCTPEDAAQILKLAVESSRKKAQEGWLTEISRAKTGNSMLDKIISGETVPVSPSQSPFGEESTALPPDPSAGAGPAASPLGPTI